MAGYFEILCGITAVITILYYYLTSTFDHWKIRGVPGPRPIPLFGNVYEPMMGRISMGDYLKELYDKYKGEPMIGIFLRRIPTLIVTDLDLVKTVLIKDFSKFADRGLPVHPKAEPLSQHLFNLKPAEWRPLRVKLSPVFTAGKLRGMFNLIIECAQQLEEQLEKLAVKDEPVEYRELAAKYATDVIGNCAFGIETNALSNEESEFRKMGRKVFQPSFIGLLRFRIRQSFPLVYDIIGRITPMSAVAKFFYKAIMDTINYRKKHNIVRNDFVDILIDLQNHPEKMPMELTDTLIASQAFAFFAAGFETSSATISHALYEMALNHNIQDKLRKEIREFYQKYDGKLTYEVVKEMPYLDKVFRETLRKYSPGPFLMRESTAPYTFPGTKVSIPKGQKVWIPVHAIHNDPDIYPKPEEFDPERFSPEAVDARHSVSFLPFGDGPRNCIGARFAVFQTKLGLIATLRNVKVDVCEKTLIPYQKEPRALVLTPKGGKLYFKLSKVD